MKLKLFIAAIMLLPFLTKAQLGDDKNKFTKADTLRGSLNENRDWWDVLRYDIEWVIPDTLNKTLHGQVKIVFKILKRPSVAKFEGILQIDLQDSLTINWVKGGILLKEKDPNVHYISIDLSKYSAYFSEIKKYSLIDSITISYQGKPRAAKNAPWDGGWIWKTDSLGRPWLSVAVQGLGASAWFPCKDHQSDEPDNGASLTVSVPENMVAVANGRLVSRTHVQGSRNHFFYKWEVKNPINSYNIVPSIGKYVNWIDTLNGQEGKLDLSYWVLDYNLERAKQQFQQVKPMLRCFEHWFGPYPFYEDGYKLVESPHLGMEHQSAVAYGNKYRNGYLGRDRSGTGWGSKWDFIIIHESGHEWFANNITTKDIADMWVHEGFTNYSETLYTEWLFGKQAGDEYNHGLRRNIQNDKPIIGIYGVNEEGSGDMYDKAGNMIHIIRKVINDDEKFRKILRGMNEVFWHQTVTTQQIENYIIQQSGIDFQKTFDQYLRTIQIPQLEFYFSKDNKKITYRWTNSIKDFNLPLVINNKKYKITTKWNTSAITKDDLSRWNKIDIEKLYYITAKQVTKP